MTRQPRTLYHVKQITVATAAHHVCDDTYTYDYQDAATVAHDLAYAHTIKIAGSYSSPRDGVFQVYATYTTTLPLARYEVQAEDDGIDLF